MRVPRLFAADSLAGQKGSLVNKEDVQHLLENVAAGSVSPDDALVQLQMQPFTDLGYAKIDTHRGIRQGASEVIYGEGKTAEQIARIATALCASGQACVLVTRLSQEKFTAARALMETDDAAAFAYHETPRMGVLGAVPTPHGNGSVVVACAGTSDLPVAEEAALTAEIMGSRVVRLYDVGVSGIHRLLAHAEEIARATAIVAVAGMEGALASVIGGMASCPVVAVPTSIGYGASFGGVAALLAMLNSCASGVSVVNIDNGFGAGYQAALIDHVQVRAR